MRAQCWIVVKLAGCVGLVIAGSGVEAQIPAGNRQAAAIVNGEAIPLADVDRVANMIIQQKFKIQPATATQRRQIRLEVLDLIINDVVMRQFMRQHGPKVGAAEVDKHFADFVAGLQKQRPPRTLAEFCRTTGQTEAHLRSTITAMLQWTEYAEKQITDAAVKQYYDESKDFFDQVAVRASHVVLQVSADGSSGERDAARQKLLALRADILAGKIDFAEAAKKHSQCPSAPNGGDIGYFSRKGMLDENFAKAAYAMKVGEVSDIITTEFGLHLIKVTDRKPGQASEFEKIKGEVRNFYIEELRHNVLRQQRRAAKIEVRLR